MLNTLGYLWEYAYSHPIWANLGIRREYARIPTMAPEALLYCCDSLIARRDAWQAADRSALCFSAAHVWRARFHYLYRLAKQGPVEAHMRCVRLPFIVRLMWNS